MEQRNECPSCGEIQLSQDEMLRQQSMGYMVSAHRCNGAPTAATVRRIIREEIAAALKKQADSAEDRK